MQTSKLICVHYLNKKSVTAPVFKREEKNTQWRLHSPFLFFVMVPFFWEVGYYCTHSVLDLGFSQFSIRHLHVV
jgi:hypothetical protein